MLLDPVAWFWGPLILGILLLLPVALARRRRTIFLAGSASLGFVLVALVATAAWTWLLKDGLGPDSVASTGAEAWRRFWGQYWGALVIASTEAALIFGTCRRRISALVRRK